VKLSPNSAPTRAIITDTLACKAYTTAFVGVGVGAVGIKTVGSGVGKAVGRKVGIYVGCIVGEAVGLAVGFNVGESVGDAVGSAVGLDDG